MSKLFKILPDLLSLAQGSWVWGTTSGSSVLSLIQSTGVYNSSVTPAGLPWNTYNYCNAPHVNPLHYPLPESFLEGNANLVYLNTVMRHHKRTPDNLFPSENTLNPPSGWDCHDVLQHIYAGGFARVFRQTVTPRWHPFAKAVWNGTCDAGQLTRQGLDDSIRHGNDFWNVYHSKLGFLVDVNEQDILIRTSTEMRTQAVASGFLFGMDRTTAERNFPVFAQPSGIDSVVPSYPCPKAAAIRQAYQSLPAWTDHLEQTAGVMRRLGETLGTVGLAVWESWYDPYFDAFNSRTCHGHPLPCNSTGGCISEEDAAMVCALGDFEYDYIWNTASDAPTYVKLTFGVFFSELAQNFKLLKSGAEPRKLRLYVGHDGTMVRLAAGLGLGNKAPLRWPAFGSEIVMEVWRTSESKSFVRVLHDGTLVDHLAWMPLDDFINLLEGQVPEDVYAACMAI